MEKIYSSKVLLKMFGGEDASPTSPLDQPLLISPTALLRDRKMFNYIEQHSTFFSYIFILL